MSSFVALKDFRELISTHFTILEADCLKKHEGHNIAFSKFNISLNSILM